MIDLEKTVEGYTARQLAVLKYRLETDYLDHAKFFLSLRENQPFIMGQHHGILVKTFERVLTGEIKRLIVNIPPSYTKTELGVIQLASYAFSRNPGCRFLHISGGDVLPLDNSSKIKEQVLHSISQRLWGVTARDDTRAKGYWKTNAKGAFYAVSSGGQIIGFRAGRSLPGFQGAILIDDPQKPDDMFSDTKRNWFPNRYLSTIKSRVDNRETPIIVIMQRLHEEDFSGQLLNGLTEEYWHHLNLPVLIDPGTEVKEYPYAVPVEADLKGGPLWEYKHDREEIEILRKNPFIFSSQYMQDPSPVGGVVFRDEWWRYYDVLPQGFLKKIITADTASKTKTANDFSVFQCWGLTRDGIFFIDQKRGKWEAPQLIETARVFYKKHNLPEQPVEGFYIEDKSSGIGLIQTLRDGSDQTLDRVYIPVVAIPRDTDKTSRVFALINYIVSGLVFLPNRKMIPAADYIIEYLAEFSRFSPQMAHKHDDQIDPTLDAIQILLTGRGDADSNSAITADGIGAILESELF